MQFRPAVRANVSLLIGLAGGTGSGKTYSAMRLAHGIAGDRPFAVIDTENGRASHYADQFRFDVAELRAQFRPDAYADAIQSADAAGYPVVVIDSCSHEWAGDGGILDWQEEELDRMADQDWKKREACKMAAWIKPKLAHKHMVSRLLQVKAHLILCFRAEPKVEMVKSDGKWVIEPKKTLTGLDGWVPVTEKNLPFELTASFLLTADAPGMPKPIKLQAQHRPLFPLDRPIDESSGRGVAEWAAGGSKPAQDAPTGPRTYKTLGEWAKAANGSGADAEAAERTLADLMRSAADQQALDQLAARMDRVKNDEMRSRLVEVYNNRSAELAPAGESA